MIGKLSGLVNYKGDKLIIVDVNGVGYRLFLSTETLQTIKTGETRDFWTHLVVKETALDLYGFTHKSELDFFELLLSVSGIGPKSALGILSLAPPEVIQKAVMAGDSSYLTKVSGIGRKNAEKIVLELKDKLGSLDTGGKELESESEAIEALQSLGYSLREARESLQKVGSEIKDTGDKVKAALKLLSR